MTLAQLQSFVLVARLGSVKAAAAELQLATARAQPHVMRSLTFLIRRLPATSYTVTLSVNLPLR